VPRGLEFLDLTGSPGTLDSLGDGGWEPLGDLTNLKTLMLADNEVPLFSACCFSAAVLVLVLLFCCRPDPCAACLLPLLPHSRCLLEVEPGCHGPRLGSIKTTPALLTAAGISLQRRHPAAGMYMLWQSGDAEDDGLL